MTVNVISTGLPELQDICHVSDPRLGNDRSQIELHWRQSTDSGRVTWRRLHRVGLAPLSLNIIVWLGVSEKETTETRTYTLIYPSKLIKLRV